MVYYATSKLIWTMNMGRGLACVQDGIVAGSSCVGYPMTLDCGVNVSTMRSAPRQEQDTRHLLLTWHVQMFHPKHRHSPHQPVSETRVPPAGGMQPFAPGLRL